MSYMDSYDYYSVVAEKRSLLGDTVMVKIYLEQDI